MKIYICLYLLINFHLALAVKFLPLAENDVPNPAKNITFDEQGNWLEITVNEWKDRIKTDTGVKSYLYQQGYNYQKHQGFVRTLTLDLQLVNEAYSADYDGMVAREEMLVAYDLVKQDPIIQTVFEQHNEVIELQGGFNYINQQPNQVCSKGQRCVHVFANTPTKPLILHAVVRLSDRTVPYPQFEITKFNKRN